MSLLVGGPDDGRWVRVERDAYGHLPLQRIVPQWLPLRQINPLVSEVRKDATTHERYYLMELFADQQRYQVYRHESLTPEEALARLIKGYTPREVEI